MAYCRIDELSPEEEGLFEAMYDAAVGYMAQAGVSEPEAGTPRRALYDLCVNYLVLDSWDRRDASAGATYVAENPRFRQYLNQLKITEPDVSELDTSASGAPVAGEAPAGSGEE